MQAALWRGLCMPGVSHCRRINEILRELYSIASGALQKHTRSKPCTTFNKKWSLKKKKKSRKARRTQHVTGPTRDSRTPHGSARAPILHRREEEKKKTRENRRFRDAGHTLHQSPLRRARSQEPNFTTTQKRAGIFSVSRRRASPQ